MLEQRKSLRYKQIYFYVESGQYSCIVALYRKLGLWREGRVVHGYRPEDWGRGTYENARDAEEFLASKYDYVEFIENSMYENYYKYVNS